MVPNRGEKRELFDPGACCAYWIPDFSGMT
jgi:hypothetical protein